MQKNNNNYILLVTLCLIWVFSAIYIGVGAIPFVNAIWYGGANTYFINSYIASCLIFAATSVILTIYIIILLIKFIFLSFKKQNQEKSNEQL